MDRDTVDNDLLLCRLQRQVDVARAGLQLLWDTAEIKGTPVMRIINQTLSEINNLEKK